MALPTSSIASPTLRVPRPTVSCTLPDASSASPSAWRSGSLVALPNAFLALPLAWSTLPSTSFLFHILTLLLRYNGPYDRYGRCRCTLYAAWRTYGRGAGLRGTLVGRAGLLR